MKGEIETRLERGIEAVQAGEEKRARDILLQVIQLDQYNEQAWLWLSAVVESAADKRVCLENVLFINPNNTRAAAGLQRLSQQSMDYLASLATLPSLVTSQAQKAWLAEEEEDEWEWAGQTEGEGARKWEWDISARTSSSTPDGKVCERCDYRNPSWAYVCDRCGADLQPVNLQDAISSGSKPRGRSALSLLAAWGGAFIFNRKLAFWPEMALATWGRILAALVMAALFTSLWRALTSVIPRWTLAVFRNWRQIVPPLLRCTAETLPLALLLLTLGCVILVLLTWVIARLVGSKQIFKIHTHLTVVAFSAWFILIALLSPFFTFVPYLLDRIGGVNSPLEMMPTLIGGAVGLVGVLWLVQALQTAHRLSAGRTVMLALLLAALGVAIGFGLDRFGGGLVGLADMLALPFLPWSE